MPEPFHGKLPAAIQFFVMGWARGDPVMAMALLDAFEERAAYGSVRRSARKFQVGEWRLRRWHRQCRRAMELLGEEVFTEKYRAGDIAAALRVHVAHDMLLQIERQ